MTQYRWTTKVLTGQWRETRGGALCDALDSGQATINRGPGAIILLKDYTTIQQRAAPRPGYSGNVHDAQSLTYVRWAA